MITDLLIGLVSALLSGLLGLIPAWTPPALLTSAWPGDLATTVAWANGFFPIYDVGLCLGIMVGLRLVLAVWRIVVFIYDRFPFKFT